MSHSELGILIGNEVCEAPHRCHIKRLETKETLMREVIPGILFRSGRPGYDGKRVSEAAVAEWCARANGHGIQTIMCLLDDEQLAYYKDVPGELLGYYKRADFVVLHHPVKDHQKPAVPLAVLAKAHVDFLAAIKPVLVHCSAGCDRTGAVVDYLVSKWPGASGGQAAPL